jgi:hypothetical protein
VWPKRSANSNRMRVGGGVFAQIEWAVSLGSALGECELGSTDRGHVHFGTFLIPRLNLINKSFRGW